MRSKVEQLKDQFKQDLEKEKNIRQEINRIKKLYKDFPKDKLKAIEPLIKSASFMKVEIELKIEDLIINGTTEIFEQGEQSFTRERPEFKIYITLIKQYSGVMKQLLDLLPQEVKKEESDELMNFLNRNKVKK